MCVRVCDLIYKTNIGTRMKWSLILSIRALLVHGEKITNVFVITWWVMTRFFFYWWITVPHLCMCWTKMSTFQGITHSHMLWRAKSLPSKASHLALHVLLFIQIWQCPAVSNKILDIYFSSPDKKKQCPKDVKTPLWLAPLFLVSPIFSVFQCFCGIVIVVGSRKKFAQSMTTQPEKGSILNLLPLKAFSACHFRKISFSTYASKDV